MKGITREGVWSGALFAVVVGTNVAAAIWPDAKETILFAGIGAIAAIGAIAGALIYRERRQARKEAP